jgi:hypothetical protein
MYWCLQFRSLIEFPLPTLSGPSRGRHTARPRRSPSGRCPGGARVPSLGRFRSSTEWRLYVPRLPRAQKAARLMPRRSRLHQVVETPAAHPPRPHHVHIHPITLLMDLVPRTPIAADVPVSRVPQTKSVATMRQVQSFRVARLVNSYVP